MPTSKLRLLNSKTEIQGIDQEEGAIFDRGSVADVQASRRLGNIRPRREIKESKLKAVQAKLASHRGGLMAQAKAVVQEVERQFDGLVAQLIRKREEEALELLGYLCR